MAYESGTSAAQGNPSETGNRAITVRTACNRLGGCCFGSGRSRGCIGPGDDGRRRRVEQHHNPDLDASLSRHSRNHGMASRSSSAYPAHSYTQLGLRAGQIFWYRARLVDRIGNQSAWTGWVRGMANDNAEDYLGDITGDFLTSADGQALQQQIDTNIEAVMQNALANNATADHQWKQYGEVRADILVVKTTIADVDKALAEMSTQVQAQIGSVTAALEDKLTAVVDASGATAIHTLKAGVRINGNYYSAGMSIAVLAQAGQPVVTRVAFNADQFVLTTGSGASQFSPFAVVGGQVFMNSAFIQDGTITSAKIGNFIQSNNYVAGRTGWNISKEGNAEFNAVTVRGTIIATEGRFSMSGPGNNVVIDGAGVTVNLANGGRIVLGSW